MKKKLEEAKLKFKAAKAEVGNGIIILYEAKQPKFGRGEWELSIICCDCVCTNNKQWILPRFAAFFFCSKRILRRKTYCTVNHRISLILISIETLLQNNTL